MRAAAREAVATRAASDVRELADRGGRGRVVRDGPDGPRRLEDDDGRLLEGAEVEAPPGAGAPDRGGVGSGARRGGEWQAMGTKAAGGLPEADEQRAASTRKPPWHRGFREVEPTGIEP